MTPLPNSPTPPQTAAELLAGLRRSQLFAESLFGQVYEQSRPYLDRPAGEYAIALVEKRVLTSWQATELLAGRVGLYAGTFRLLERLSGTDEALLFVAEQGRLQRLVMLQISRVGIIGDSVAEDCAVDVGPIRGSFHHAHIARCITVQQTAQLRLVAYEFMEARPLSDLLVATPIKRPHAAHLVRQFASVLAVLREEVIESIDLSAVWIDSQGELKLLVGPCPLVNDLSAMQQSPQREARQLAVVHRFASALGGLPEVANCQLIIEVVQSLSEIAEPWAAPDPSATVPCPRANMNRHLRRGPALRLIVSLGEELQFALDGLGEETASRPSVVEETGPTQSDAARTPTSPAVPGRSRRRAWGVTAALVLVVAAAIASQWAGRWRVRPAAATTEEAQTAPASGP